MIKTVGLILNTNNKQAAECAEQAASYLKNRGIQSYDVQHKSPEWLPNPDMIVTFGGDGTLLIGARYALKYDIPLLGINLGTVGFLTEEEPKRIEQALQ